MNIARPISLLVAALFTCVVASVEAQTPQAQTKRTYRNPIIDRIGPADLHVLKHDGRYYMYPTTDGKGYDVFVSDDLVHWEQKPKCFTDPREGEQTGEVE